MKSYPSILLAIKTEKEIYFCQLKKSIILRKDHQKS